MPCVMKTDSGLINKINALSREIAKIIITKEKGESPVNIRLNPETLGRKLN